MELLLLGIAVGLASASFSYYPVRWIAWFMNEYTTVYPYLADDNVGNTRIRQSVYQWTYRVVAAVATASAWLLW